MAYVLKVERNWLLHGLCEVEGESPIIENPGLGFVAVPYVNVRASMGVGQTVDTEPDYGRPYHFQQSWMKYDLKSEPENLRITRRSFRRKQHRSNNRAPKILTSSAPLVEHGRGGGWKTERRARCKTSP